MLVEKSRIGEDGYYVGLDMGTNSVGWAVTSENYSIIEFKKKAMWGARLFDEALPAEERRTFRAGRRRLERKKWRLSILQSFFNEEINKVDENFFIRLKDSALWMEDKNDKLDSAYCLFSDENYSDKQYYAEFPTIYHLRKALIENKKQYDIRLVYLSLHNILKHRGHFLFEGSNMEVISSFESVFNDFQNFLIDNYDFQLDCTSTSQFEEILKNKSLTKTRKKEELSKVCSIIKTDKQKRTIVGLLSGTTESISNLYDDDELDDVEKNKVCFSSGNYDEDRENLESILMERAMLLDKMKALYDWSILAEILSGGELNGKQYISVSKVRVYEKHKKDLAILKRVIKRKCPDKYKTVFSDNEEKSNYCSYVGHCIRNGRKKYVSKCNRDDFLKFIGGILGKLEEDEDVIYLKKEKESGNLLPLQISGDNGVIPYQVHKMELVEIINNVSEYIPFLRKVDETGLSVAEKIVKTFEFRIPYYVGPLNTAHIEKGANCWLKRKEKGAILPWNLEQKVDIDASAEQFINRMTNECTYLRGKDVIPRCSLLYSEYMVLNELNNVRIDEKKLPVTIKQRLYDILFRQHRKISIKKLIGALKCEGYEISEEDISGVDGGFTTSLGVYHDYKRILGDRIDNESVRNMLEQIIFWSTVYSDGGKILRRRVKSSFSDVLTEDEINRVCKVKCTGWANFSREFLTEIYGSDTVTGEIRNIITTMRETDDNLMQLLSSKYTFREKIDELNKDTYGKDKECTYEDLVKDLYVSPSVKRSIWQTIQIVQEIKQCLKTEPKKIFIEMARGPEEKKRTVSRKNQLLELYKSINDEMNGTDWTSLLEKFDENAFRSQNLYLYFTQMGRDMYTGNPIDLDDILGADNLYDRDHIYPQSITKDDSILNNLVLVNKNDNKRKDDGLVPQDIQQNMRKFWYTLREKNLISEEKYKRLIRNTPLTDDELAGFISRQIVETRQSTKAAATVLGELFPNTQIVYVKATAVSDFKRDYADVVKVREINDYHHAKDAYMNIVVGNVYNSKFTSNPVKWFSENRSSVYSLNHMFDYDLTVNNKIVWQHGKDGTLKHVKEMVNRNDILFTRYAYCNKGGLFNQQLVKAGKGKVSQKKNTMTDLSKYGGYDSVKPSYFTLVESEKKGKKIRTIEVVPVYLAKMFEENHNEEINYLAEKYELENPKIIIPKIKKNAKIIIDGFPMHIAGSNGKQIEAYVAAQLVVDNDIEKILKKVTKYIERNAERKNKAELLKIDEHDRIEEKDILYTYEYLLEKLLSSIYSKRPANQSKTFIEGREKFFSLKREEKCILVNEMLNLFKCKSTITNLSLIGGTSEAGRLRVNKDITKAGSAKLVYQSVTGLYQQEIDLKKI